MKMDKLYDYKKFEQDARNIWDQEKIYSFEPAPPSKVFSIDTPPPTVSGSLHIGHIFSYTHTDFVARYKRMKGFNVFYPMGFDDNGLPTERFVEKKNNVKAHFMPRSEFIALCLRETHEVEKIFEDLWRKMGLSIDWTKVYSTISDNVRRISQLSFIDLYNKGLVYRKEEPSLYCTTCKTSVAQAEIENKDVTTTFNNITFTTEDGEKLVIATTRPEMLPACVAIFFHPEDDRYKHLTNKFAITPIFEKPVRIIPDEMVDPAKGTGIVMCCTFGDQTDILWYKTHKLPFVHLIGFDGKLTKEGGPLEGLRSREARKKILELLKVADALVDQKSITHNVGTHERCKQEIEYLILHQWFINILKHKNTFLTLANQINWHPKFMKIRYLEWVKNLNWDWCISRQRFFGIPFPVWHCLDCSHVILADKQDLPIDPQEQAYKTGKCPKCSGTNLEPDTDVMDTWNTSSLTPQINLHWPDQSPDQLQLPMSMRPQAHDIIRTWAFYTIVKSHFHHNTIPWKDIVISGHVLSGKEKLSKSKENTKIDPVYLLDRYPSDAIRYWSASGRLGTDTAFSENQLKIGQRLITKLWNAFRFISEHISNDKQTKLDIQDPLNQWILHTFTVSYNEYQKHFDNYHYHTALEVSERFFWHDFCDNYLELIKDRLFNPDKYPEEIQQETQFTLYEVGFGILQIFAPFLPHITENLYQMFYKNKQTPTSIHLTHFSSEQFNYTFEESAELINTILQMVSTVRKLKSENQLSLKVEIEKLIIYSQDQRILRKLQEQIPLLTGICKAQDVVLSDSPIEFSELIEHNGKLSINIKL